MKVSTASGTSSEISSQTALASEVASPKASLRGLVHELKSLMLTLPKSNWDLADGSPRTFWSWKATADEAALRTRAEVDSRMMMLMCVRCCLVVVDDDDDGDGL